MAVAEIRPDWTVGTLTLTSGSSNFTTAGSALQTAAIQAGDAIITSSGDFLVIATITGQNAGTLMQPCPASAAGAGQPLRIRFQPDGSRYNGATADLVQRLGSGNVYEFSGLTGAADRVPYFTGPGTMALTALTPFARTVIAAADGAAGYDALGDVPDSRISETLPQVKAYRRGNVLGNVSQYGGVPTGAVIQRGSNANGEFVRFADGTQICTINNSPSRVMVVNTPSGSSFRSELTTWTFPATFATSPVVLGSFNLYSGGSIASGAIYGNLGNLVALSPIAVPEGTQWSAAAIGRWF